MATLPVQIVTPAETVFSGEALGVLLPAYDGERGILPNHADFIGELGSGVVRINIPGGREMKFAVSVGAYQVASAELTIMAMAAQKPDNVNFDQVREELAGYEEQLSNLNRAVEDAVALERMCDYCRAQLSLK